MSEDLGPDKEKPEEQGPKDNESWDRFLQFSRAILSVSKEEIEEEKRREEEEQESREKKARRE